MRTKQKKTIVAETESPTVEAPAPIPRSEKSPPLEPKPPPNRKLSPALLGLRHALASGIPRLRSAAIHHAADLLAKHRGSSVKIAAELGCTRGSWNALVASEQQLADLAEGYGVRKGGRPPLPKKRKRAKRRKADDALKLGA